MEIEILRQCVNILVEYQKHWKGFTERNLREIEEELEEVTQEWQTPGCVVGFIRKYTISLLTEDVFCHLIESWVAIPCVTEQELKDWLERLTPQEIKCLLTRLEDQGEEEWYRYKINPPLILCDTTLEIVKGETTALDMLKGEAVVFSVGVLLDNQLLRQLNNPPASLPPFQQRLWLDPWSKPIRKGSRKKMKAIAESLRSGIKAVDEFLRVEGLSDEDVLELKRTFSRIVRHMPVILLDEYTKESEIYLQLLLWGWIKGYLKKEDKVYNELKKLLMPRIKRLCPPGWKENWSEYEIRCEDVLKEVLFKFIKQHLASPFEVFSIPAYLKKVIKGVWKKMKLPREILISEEIGFNKFKGKPQNVRLPKKKGLPVRKTAEVTGLNERTIYSLIKAGKVPISQSDPYLLIANEGVKKLREIAEQKQRREAIYELASESGKSKMAIKKWLQRHPSFTKEELHKWLKK